MKLKIGVFLLFFYFAQFSISVLSGETGKSDFPVLAGPYLGQPSPGLSPEIFAPGIVSQKDRDELNAAFSPEGDELYFSVYIDGTYTIMRMKQRRGVWTAPRAAPFSGQYNDVDPNFSQGGKELFFCSSRPVASSGRMDIWYVKRLSGGSGGWSQPLHAGMSVNTGENEVHPVLAKNGFLYFSSGRAGGFGDKDLYRARWAGGHCSEPENLGITINSPHNDGDCFITAGGEFLIFCSTRPGGSGGGDLYLSRRGKDGSWSKAGNMGKVINTPADEYAPSLSPCGKFLFFARKERSEGGTGDVYWVNSEILEKTWNELDRSNR